MIYILNGKLRFVPSLRCMQYAIPIFARRNARQMCVKTHIENVIETCKLCVNLCTNLCAILSPNLSRFASRFLHDILH